MGGTEEEYGGFLDLDQNGSIFTSGAFRGTTDFDPGSGVFNLTGSYYNTFVSKLDSAGNFLWAGKLGSANNVQNLDMDVDVSGNVLIVGFFELTADFDPSPADTFNLASNGGNDIFICKLDNDGNFLWAKQMGAFPNDEAWAVTSDAAGNVFVTGLFHSTVDFDPGPGVYNLTATGSYAPYVLKLDANGNFVWAVHFNSAYGLGDGISLDNAGNIYCVGSFDAWCDFDPGAGTFNLTSGGAMDPYIVKLNSSGGFIWAKQIVGAGSGSARSIASNVNTGLIISGTFTSTADFDPGAGTANLTSAGADDSYIIKLDSAGNFQWVTNIGTSAQEYSPTITVDDTGNVYSSAGFTGTIDVDPGAGTVNLTAIGGRNSYLLKFDSLANFNWVKQMGGAGPIDNITPGDIVLWQDAIYTSGYFYGTCDFNPDAGFSNFSSNGSADYYIHKLSANGAIDIIENSETNFSLYPNPAQETITFDFGNFYTSHMSLEIFDVHGRLMYAENFISEKTKSISLNSFSPGMYFVNVNNGTVNYCQKVVTQ